MAAPGNWLERTNVPLTALARYFVGGVFAYLAVMKLLDPITFLKLLHQYNFFPKDPPHVANLIAISVPWLELLCGVALLLGVWTRAAAVTILGMLLCFMPLLVQRANELMALHPDRYARFCDVCYDCGCGTGEICICEKLTENTLLIGGALLILLARARRWCLEALWTRRPEPAPPKTLAAVAPAPPSNT